MENTKIVIVGAGLSGISAAAKLLENGFEDIVILEAENRIGGRIHSIDYGTGKIDLGGQWIHGEENNSIFEMVKDNFDLGTTAFEEYEENYSRSDGSTPDQDQCARLTELSEKILERSFSEMREFNGSLGDFFIDQYTKALNTELLSSVTLIRNYIL
jgi:monoamine oxidase